MLIPRSKRTKKIFGLSAGTTHQHFSKVMPPTNQGHRNAGIKLNTGKGAPLGNGSESVCYKRPKPAAV
jgi:hypothetical protein